MQVVKKMSFSLTTKSELARVAESKRCCRLAELAALVKVNGVLKVSANRQVSLNVITENAAVARKIFSLCKDLFQVAANVVARRKAQLKKNNIYMISISGHTGDILRQTGLLNEAGELLEGVNKKLVRRDCCRRAYLRGVFLGCGSINNPGNSYHLEMILHNKNYAQDIYGLLKKFSLSPGLIARKNGYALYLKEAEQIVHCLSVMGAHTSVLTFENVRIYKEMRNQINRLVNCETANLGKTINASLQQQETIYFLASTIGLEKLPPSLRQVAEARLSHPDASLRELGELLDPKISKSGVRHRLRKLEEMAQYYQAKRVGSP